MNKGGKHGLHSQINNLYPCALSSSAMYRDIDWVSASEYEKILREGESFIMSTTENAEFGYYYEVSYKLRQAKHERNIQKVIFI